MAATSTRIEVDLGQSVAHSVFHGTLGCLPSPILFCLRFTAGAAGFFILSPSFKRPEW